MASNIDILLEFRLSGEGELCRRGRSAVTARTRPRYFIVALCKQEKDVRKQERSPNLPRKCL